MSRTAVAYLRVSTQKQGSSGLGIEAQRAEVASYCRAAGLELIAEYIEVESGRVKLRPVLHDALERAEATRSLLVIARLDRLSRSAAFIANLLESDVRFVACDVPSANRLVLHILGAVAEEEARAASLRTRAAMHAAKLRGVKFGTAANLPAGAAMLGARACVAARRRRRDATLARIANRIRELRDEGASFGAIAAKLNAEHYKTSGGKKWRRMSIWKAVRQLQA